MCRTQCALALVALFLGLAHSWDIAVTVEDRLEFYTTNGTKTDTVRLDSQNLTAIVYDEVHNMLLYVNNQSDNDGICGYNISSGKHKCYIERNGGNIHGLAFDPITEMLFFTDTKESSINWMAFKPESVNNVTGNLLIKMAAGIPTDIAVDSFRGYIYWINTNLTTSTIERARFNGSEREVVINASNNWDLHSLVIDQQYQKIYWVMPKTRASHYIYIADLSGKNQEIHHKYFTSFQKPFVTHPNVFAISKEFLFTLSWCSTCFRKSVWKYSKSKAKRDEFGSLFKIDTESYIGIAANYKVSEQIPGVIHAYKALTSLDSLEIAREYVMPFCVHGIKVNGPSLCKCTPGYIGKRCNVSVCENYCLQGDCSFNEEGLPECRCNAGYSGERCEVNTCYGYCLNNGTCSLNEENEPVCQCIDDYAGDRCDVPVCLNHASVEILSRCRCRAGRSPGPAVAGAALVQRTRTGRHSTAPSSTIQCFCIFILANYDSNN